MQNVYDRYGVRKVNSFSALNTDNAAFDAFGRLRVSEPATWFDSKQIYDGQPLFWEELITATGSSTFSAVNARTRIAVAASGDQVIRQTRQHWPYRAGKSQLIAITFVLGAASTNVTKRIGAYTASGTSGNGVYLQQAGTGALTLNIASTAGGSNQSVAQASWNDPLDGTGPSGMTLDVTKTQIMEIDYQWLGVGRVRVGFNINGIFVLAHAFNNANSTLSTVYATTPSWPVRFAITCAGGAPSGGSAYIDCICCSVSSEGGIEDSLSNRFSANIGATGLGVTTRVPVLSIQPKATFNSVVNRAMILPLSINAMATTQPALIELVYAGSLTGASFASANASSHVNYDTAASAISGGITIDSFYVPASVAGGANALSSEFTARYPLTLDISGANPISLSIVATRASGSGTATVHAAMDWAEII